MLGSFDNLISIIDIILCIIDMGIIFYFIRTRTPSQKKKNNFKKLYRKKNR